MYNYSALTMSSVYIFGVNNNMPKICGVPDLSSDNFNCLQREVWTLKINSEHLQLLR